MKEKSTIKTVIIITITILTTILLCTAFIYYIKMDTFEDAVDATGTYTGNSYFNPENGIFIQKENDDGTFSELSIEEIFNQIDNAEKYLKDDEQSTKEEKLQYLMNAELVTRYPYIESLANDETKLNGVVKFYRYTSQLQEEGASQLEGHQMIYVSEQELDEMIENSERSGDKEVFKYFTINENDEIVVATWDQTNMKIVTNDPELTETTLEEEYGKSFSENEDGIFESSGITITKKALVKTKILVEQYSMPFNLLWAFLVTTESYDFVEELAKLAYETEISVGIYDNETTVEENDSETYAKKIRFTENTELIFRNLEEISLTIDTSTIINNCKGTIQDDVATHTNNLDESEEGEITYHYIDGASENGLINSLNEQEQTFSTTINKTAIDATNPTIGVFYVDNWLAKWNVGYEIQEEGQPEENDEGTIEQEPYQNIPTEKISRSLMYGPGLMGRVLTNHSKQVKQDAIYQILQGDTSNEEVVEKLEDKIAYEQWPTAQKAKVNVQYETTTIKTPKTYKKQEDINIEDEGIKFKEIINSPEHYKSRKAILELTEWGWFWKYIRSAEDTEQLEEPIRIMFNKALDTEKFGKFSEEEMDEILSKMEPRNFTKVTTIGTGVSPFGCNLSREEFVYFAQNYGESILSGLAEEFYDICTSPEYNVNPCLAYGWAALESGWGRSAIENGDNNLFQMGTYYGQTSGFKYDTLEDSIKNFCEWVVDRAEPGTTGYEFEYKRGQEYLEVNSKFEGTPDNNIYVLFSAYSGLPDVHDGNARAMIEHTYEFLYGEENGIRCTHENDTDATTLQEKADFVQYTIELRLKIATDVFGGDIFLGGGSVSDGGSTGSTHWADRILEEAQEFHDKCRLAGWTYNNVSGLLAPVEKHINEGRVTCCSTYVGCVLYLAGLYPEAQTDLNSHFHSQYSHQRKFEAEGSGWEKIEISLVEPPEDGIGIYCNPEDIINYLEPGDIVMYVEPGGSISHENIYAGDGMYYDGGYVSTPMPMQRGSSYLVDYHTILIYRPPRIAETDNNSEHRLLKAAQEVHDEEIDWIYYTEHYLGKNSLISYDIEKALNNPNKTTCCATYVGCALYRAGYFTEEEMNSINYNGPSWLVYLLNQNGWEKITDENKFEAGDIVFMDKDEWITVEWSDEPQNPLDHVQIYAGDNLWYNAGYTAIIQAPQPYDATGWTQEFDKWYAYRPPY